MTPDLVRGLQAMLNALLRPSPNLKVDGIFGPRTRAALHRLQVARATVPSSSVHKMVSASSASVTPTDTQRESDRWMAIAEGELGQAEIAGNAANPRIVAYHATTSLAATSDEVPWCSSFVNWVMKQAGLTGTKSAAARSWLGWGTASEPRYGAVTVIHRKGATSDAATGSSSGYHVAFFISQDSHRIALLGGNQHDMVKISRFNLANYSVEACRWPG